MRVLLIHPPTSYALKSVLNISSPPLGLAYLASTIRNEGFDVRIIDCPAEDLSLLELGMRIKQYDPDVVGITATTPAIPDAYRVAELAKKINPNIIVVMGGPHVSFTSVQTLTECPSIDVIVRGEGEETFAELLRAMEAGGGYEDIRGITYRSGDIIKSNPPRPFIKNIDEIPIPAYDLLPMDRYTINGIRFGTIITSRGCPYNCIFCASSALFGKIFRAHSPERVLEELRILRYEYNIREIEFLDDTFTLNPRRAREISKKIIEEDLDISWSASSRVNTFDYETGILMRKAGAHTLYFGIESGTQKILNFIRKMITLKQSRDAVKTAKKIGFNTLGSFVIGFPIETEQDINKTIDFSRKLNLDYAQYTIATPFPGTYLWSYALKHNLLLTRNWRKYTAVDVVMRSFYLSPKQIKRFLIKAYVAFYLRLKYLINDIVKRKGFLALRAITGTLKSVIRRIWQR